MFVITAKKEASKNDETGEIGKNSENDKSNKNGNVMLWHVTWSHDYTGLLILFNDKLLFHKFY